MFGSFTELLTSLIAEWYSVWREVTQVKQGLALLVLGWVTACYRCLDSTCSALTQLLQTAIVPPACIDGDVDIDL